MDNFEENTGFKNEDAADTAAGENAVVQPTAAVNAQPDAQPEITSVTPEVQVDINPNPVWAETETAAKESIPASEPAFTAPAADAVNQAPPVSQGVQYNAAPEMRPVFNRVEYSEQKPIKNYSPFSRGVKIFCGLLAAVILVTGGLYTGYYFGKNKSRNLFRDDVKMDLAAKPKDTEGMTAAEVYDTVNPSIVGVRVYNSKRAFDASGVIYTKDGYVITNDHIYSSVGAPKFKIYTYDGKEYDAVYVAGDVVSDLAVLKIENGKDFSVPVFGDSSALICGENVYAIGRPSDASDPTSITSGTVSLPKRRVQSSKTNYSSSLIQTDSAINPGSSGGALANMYGQVVGITTSKLSGDDYDLMCFSVPTVTVKRVVDQLISKGKVTDRAKLGITYTEINSVSKTAGNYADTGLLIVSVSSDSDLYGKADKDDIITHVEGVKITKDDMILDIIESRKAGDTVTITVLTSSGDEKELTVKLGANVGESSYKQSEAQTESSSDSSSSSDDGKTFDFPFGE